MNQIWPFQCSFSMESEWQQTILLQNNRHHNIMILIIGSWRIVYENMLAILFESEHILICNPCEKFELVVNYGLRFTKHSTFSLYTQIANETLFHCIIGIPFITQNFPIQYGDCPIKWTRVLNAHLHHNMFIAGQCFL